MRYLFVSRDLNVVRLLADRVPVMYLGRSMGMGPVSDVFRQVHPFTRALSSCLREREGGVVEQLTVCPLA